MPAGGAWYVSAVARALPRLDEHIIRYHLPQERGWSYLHCMQLENGLDTRWPHPEHNPEHRWWQRVVQWISRAPRGMTKPE